MFFDNDKIVAEKKLIILYILYYIDIPLSKEQLSNIVLENSLIDYFTMNQCIIELENSDFIRLNEKNDTYNITSSGTKTLIAFENRVDTIIKGIIHKYIDKNKTIIKAEKETSANIVKKNNDEYIVILKAFENDITIVEISINVISLQQANIICEGWKKNAHNIFSDLINSLTH